MLGSFSVGKSSLVRQFVETIFSEKYLTTIGVKVDKKVVNVRGQEISLVLWDIHGDDIYQRMQMNYLRGMAGYLLDIGRVPAILVLNKSDLGDQWEIDDGQQAKLVKDGWIVAKTSAKTGEGVEKVFQQLAEAVVGPA
jgi:GTPase SAR1 family protein